MPDPEGGEAEVDPEQDALLAATRAGDFEALLAVLDPDVVLRTAGAPGEVRDAHAVARGAVAGSPRARSARLALALVNGRVGVVAAERGGPWRVTTFEFKRGRIAEIEVFFDPARLRRLDVTVLPDGPADVADWAT